MSRLIFTFVLMLSCLCAKQNIDTRIKNTASEISSCERTQQDINKKMNETANAILLQKKEIDAQQEYLKKLQNELSNKENSHENNLNQLKSLKEVQEQLKSKTNEIEKELISAIAQSVSISIILQEKYAVTQESLMENEVLNLLLKDSKQKVKDLQREYHDSSKDINTLKEQTASLEVAISSIESKKKEILKTQQKNKESLEKLEIAKSSYKKELNEILDKQDTLKKTLSELNIIKIDETKKAQEKAQREEAFNAKEYVADSGGSPSSLPDVKKKGSSYQEVKTRLYTGAKTIPPFTPYQVTKKYGTYTDPIYGIKVFNESITLKSSQENTKVSTIFNGKVIYADKTAVLNNIVIVEHDDGLHTIYANLSQIAPDIKKGTKIKKGTIIGRISEELIFEATQQSFHINPITLFE